ncbi:MAG TPA: hypothetical protein VLJ59_03965 [Mycobacteriales bacterium]|nr:hypothetical protein [Mycobacteriales bacterium]
MTNGTRRSWLERWADRENIRRQADYRCRLADWERVGLLLGWALRTAQEYAGQPGGPHAGSTLAVRPDERVFWHFGRVALVEVARPPGSSGLGYTAYSAVAASDVPFGRPAERPRVRAHGQVTVSDRRVVFHGAPDREWAFDRLIGVEHALRAPLTLLHVSDAETVSGLSYPGMEPAQVRLMIELALAHHRGTVAELIDLLAVAKARQLAARPAPPLPTAPPAPIIPNMPAATTAPRAVVSPVSPQTG